jgi:hypothetical protein
VETLVLTKELDLKIRAVKRAVALKVPELVKWGAQQIYDGAAANLKGPYYGMKGHTYKSGPQTGKMPIPRRTTKLSKSLKMIPLSTMVWAVYSDPNIAPHNKIVHDGTIYVTQKDWVVNIKPRRFIGDVRRDKEAFIKKKFNKDLKEAIQAVGR